MILAYQILIVVILVLLGGFFAGSETGVYCLSLFRLRLGIEQKRPFYTLLGKLMDDSHGLVFSMLIANNLTHYIATSIVTLILLGASIGEGSAGFYTTVIMTPILFVFSEVIPKNIYYHRANDLMPRLAPLLWSFHTLFKNSGAIAALKFVSHLFSRPLGAAIEEPATVTSSRRSYMEQIIQETHDEGILSPLQDMIMKRMINISSIFISSVMTPIGKVQTLDINTTRAELLKTLGRFYHTRFPVYDGSRNNITGFIDIYEVLSTDEDFQSLGDFVKPIAQFNSTTSVINAINKMRQHGYKIVMVTAGKDDQRVVGIVTMKDLVEELTGELVQW